jgi:hypothetical protein
VELQIGANGLGDPVAIQLPVTDVVEPLAYGGRTVSNASSFTGRPYVSKVELLDRHHAVAITQDIHRGTSVAYLVDLATRRVIATEQMPAGQVNAAAADGKMFVIGTNESKLVLFDSNLKMTSQRALLGVPAALAYAGGVVFASELSRQPGGGSAIQLERVDITSHRSSVMVSTRGTFAGPVWADSTLILWAEPEAGQIASFTNARAGKEAGLCKDIRSLAVTPTFIMGVCLNGAKLAFVDRTTHSVTELNAGGFPAAIVVAS